MPFIKLELEERYRTFPAPENDEFGRRVAENLYVIVHEGILNPLAMDRTQ
jgi:hypothetical protein